MSFQLRADEPVRDGIKRNVRAQIEKALKHLRAESAPHRPGSSDTEAVGEVRKCFKRVRAALRLVREELGDERYHEENIRFRDAARPLTQVRDAGILVETVDGLRKRCPKSSASTGVFSRIREALLANQREVTRRVLEADKALGQVEAAATDALARLGAWGLERDGWPAIETGLRRVYREGHRALARAAEHPSVLNLHEWRKQTKYLWHQLQLIEPALASTERPRVDEAHKLSSLLGEDHDLAVLRETLAADPAAYGGHGVLKGVFGLIDRRREELERQAFALGREIYKDSPRAFTSRIEAASSYAR